MHISICDDDTAVTIQLTKYLQEYFEKHNLKLPKITVFHNGEDLLCDPSHTDIVFLDVEMPGLSGIYIGNELKSKKPGIIIFIVTSYAEYLDEAMRFHVFRYLLKPLDKQRLFRNMKDALSLYVTSVTKIPLETKDSFYSIPASEIVCVEAQDRKVTVYTASAQYASIHNINYWQDLLDINCFFRSHRSFIVNLEHVTDFNHSLIHLDCSPFDAYMTRRKYSLFREAYLLYLESMQ